MDRIRGPVPKWRVVVTIAVVALFLYWFVWMFWNFEGSFASQLERADYPKADITTSRVATWAGRSQRAYDARVQVGTCLLHLQRAQSDDGYKLIAVNGQPISLGDSPTRQEVLNFLKGKGIDCIG